MFFRKRKEKPLTIFPQSEFNYVIESANQMLESVTTTQEKKEILEYFIELIKRDLEAHLLTDLFRQNPAFTSDNDFTNVIPRLEESVIPKETKVVDFSKDQVFVLPWEAMRLCNAITTVGNYGYKFIERNIRAYYYTYFDFTIVTNGRHHTAVGCVKRKGNILAPVIDGVVLLKNIDTNGAQWFSSFDKQSLGKVVDYRIAILFQLTKQKYELEMEYGFPNYQVLDNKKEYEDYLRLKEKDKLWDAYYDTNNELNYSKSMNEQYLREIEILKKRLNDFEESTTLKT